MLSRKGGSLAHLAEKTQGQQDFQRKLKKNAKFSIFCVFTFAVLKHIAQKWSLKNNYIL